MSSAGLVHSASGLGVDPSSASAGSCVGLDIGHGWLLVDTVAGIVVNFRQEPSHGEEEGEVDEEFHDSYLRKTVEI